MAESQKDLFAVSSSLREVFGGRENGQGYGRRPYHSTPWGSKALLGPEQLAGIV
jgi:hypothetical protein